VPRIAEKKERHGKVRAVRARGLLSRGLAKKMADLKATELDCKAPVRTKIVVGSPRTIT